MIIDCKFKPCDRATLIGDPAYMYVVKKVYVHNCSKISYIVAKATNTYDVSEFMLDPFFKKTKRDAAGDIWVINNNYNVGDKVYVSTDLDQQPCHVCRIVIQ